jgi:hypothetical protein
MLGQKNRTDISHDQHMKHEVIFIKKRDRERDTYGNTCDFNQLK